MNRRFSTLAIILTLGLMRCTEFDQTGLVIAIADGDTFTMLDSNKKSLRVRLYGIDAPEKSQDYGEVAKKFLADLIFNEQVTIREIETDQYGRTIAIVMIDSIVVNEALLKTGLAWHYLQYDHNPYWALLEQNAQAQNKGLWAAKDPIAPWNFRKHKLHHRSKEKT